MLEELATVPRSNAHSVGADELSRVQEAQVAYYEGQLAAHRGNFREALRLAHRNAELVARQHNPRGMESYHDLMGLIFFLQGKYAQAVEHYRQADLGDMYNKYHLALALEGARQRDEARKLFKEVAESDSNSFGYARVREDAQKRTGWPSANR